MPAILDCITRIQAEAQLYETLAAEAANDGRLFKAWATEWPEKAAALRAAKFILHQWIERLAELNKLPRAPDEPSRPRVQHFITLVRQRLDFSDDDAAWDQYIKAGVHAGLAQFIAGAAAVLMLMAMVMLVVRLMV